MGESFDLWTDGACSGSQLAGGWAAILIHHGGLAVAHAGFEPVTTNNRMELMGVIRGLEAIGQATAHVTIWTDSSYVKNCFTQGWMVNWKQNGWISSRGDAVANRDLWERLDLATQAHIVSWKHIRGHGKKYTYNILADQMAVTAKKEQAGVTTIL